MASLAFHDTDSVRDEVGLGFTDVEYKLVVSARLQKDSLEHEKTIQDFLGKFEQVRMIGLLLMTDYYLRTNIFVLYARNLDGNPSHASIAITLYLSYLCSGFVSFIAGYFGDHWRFDYLICIAAFGDVLTFALEASAQSWLMLAIPYILGGQALHSILAAYSMKMLPLYYSQIFQIELAQFVTLGNILGPVLSGVIAAIFGYRAVFIISAVIALILFLLCYFTIVGTHTYFIDQMEQFQGLYESHDAQTFKKRYILLQDDLQSEDLPDRVPDELKYLISDDYKFPHLMSSANNTDHSSETGDSSDYRESDGSYIWNLTKYQFYIYVAISLCQSIALTTETALTGWFVAYMKDKYDESIILSTGMLSFAALCTIPGFLLVKILFDKLQARRDSANAIANSNNDNTKYWIHSASRYDFGQFLVLCVIVSGVFRVILTFWIIPDNVFTFGLGSNKESIKYSMWIYLFLFAFFLGMFALACNVMIVNITPHASSGKLLGAQVASKYWVKAIGTLVVGLLWSTSYDWLWYGIGLFSIISTLGIVGVAVFETKRGKEEEEEKL